MKFLVVINSRPGFTDHIEPARAAGLKVCALVSQDATHDQYGACDRTVVTPGFSADTVIRSLEQNGIPLSQVAFFWTLNSVHVAVCHELNQVHLGTLASTSRWPTRHKTSFCCVRLSTAVSKVNLSFGRPIGKSRETRSGYVRPLAARFVRALCPGSRVQPGDLWHRQQTLLPEHLPEVADDGPIL